MLHWVIYDLAPFRLPYTSNRRGHLRFAVGSPDCVASLPRWMRRGEGGSRTRSLAPFDANGKQRITVITSPDGTAVVELSDVDEK